MTPGQPTWSLQGFICAVWVTYAGLIVVIDITGANDATNAFPIPVKVDCHSLTQQVSLSPRAFLGVMRLQKRLTTTAWYLLRHVAKQ